MNLLMTLCLAVLSFEQPHAPPPVSIRMLVPGEYHGWEVKGRSGEVWLGLFETDCGCLLRGCVLQVEPSVDPYFDEGDEMTGKVVSAASEHVQPVFMLLPPPGSALVAGPVGSVTVDSSDLLPETTISLGAYGSLQTEDKGVFLEKGGLRQRLSDIYTDGYGEGVNVVWAGDLDGDGRVDLVLNDRPHYACRFCYRLFLSGQARGGRLVVESASILSVSC